MRSAEVCRKRRDLEDRAHVLTVTTFVQILVEWTDEIFAANDAAAIDALPCKNCTMPHVTLIRLRDHQGD